MIEYVHVDFIEKGSPHKVYYEPLDERPNGDTIYGQIKIDGRAIGFYTGFYPDEDEADHIFFLDNNYEPVVLAEFRAENNRIVISYTEVPNDHYLIVYYRTFLTNWKEEGF